MKKTTWRHFPIRTRRSATTAPRSRSTGTGCTMGTANPIRAPSTWPSLPRATARWSTRSRASMATSRRCRSACSRPGGCTTAATFTPLRSWARASGCPAMPPPTRPPPCTPTISSRASRPKLELFQEIAARADAARGVLPDDANSHYLFANALGRYSQGISVLEALAQGLGGKVKEALERTLALQPEHAEAHAALGTYHAEVVSKVGRHAGRAHLRREQGAGAGALRARAARCTRSRPSCASSTPTACCCCSATAGSTMPPGSTSKPPSWNPAMRWRSWTSSSPSPGWRRREQSAGASSPASRLRLPVRIASRLARPRKARPNPREGTCRRAATAPQADQEWAAGAGGDSTTR